MAHESMHCAAGHTFPAPYRDQHGAWCPQCGNTAHTGAMARCEGPYCADPARPLADWIASADASLRGFGPSLPDAADYDP